MHNLDGTVRFGQSFRFGSRTRFDPDPVVSVDPDWQSGSGPGKNDPQKVELFEIV
ncbi:MAG: hypothetical protein ACK55Z_05785 [bacterium]